MFAKYIACVGIVFSIFFRIILILEEDLCGKTLFPDIFGFYFYMALFLFFWW